MDSIHTANTNQVLSLQCDLRCSSSYSVAVFSTVLPCPCCVTYKMPSVIWLAHLSFFLMGEQWEGHLYIGFYKWSLQSHKSLHGEIQLATPFTHSFGFLSAWCWSINVWTVWQQRTCRVPPSASDWIQLSLAGDWYLNVVEAARHYFHRRKEKDLRFNNPPNHWYCYVVRELLNQFCLF